MTWKNKFFDSVNPHWTDNKFVVCGHQPSSIDKSQCAPKTFQKCHLLLCYEDVHVPALDGDNGLLERLLGASRLLPERLQLYAWLSGRLHRQLLGLARPEMHKNAQLPCFHRVPRHFSRSTRTVHKIRHQSNSTHTHTMIVSREIYMTTPACRIVMLYVLSKFNDEKRCKSIGL